MKIHVSTKSALSLLILSFELLQSSCVKVKIYELY